MRGRVTLVVAVTVALGACDAGSQCTVDALAAADGRNMTVTDCGDFTLGATTYTDAAMVTAQSCVLGAVAGGSAFRLLYDGTTAGLRAGFTGTVVPNGLTVHSYAGAGSGSSALVSGRSCSTLTATPSCTPRVGTPCLSCADATADAVECRG